MHPFMLNMIRDNTSGLNEFKSWGWVGSLGSLGGPLYESPSALNWRVDLIEDHMNLNSDMVGVQKRHLKLNDMTSDFKNL